MTRRTETVLWVALAVGLLLLVSGTIRRNTEASDRARVRSMVYSVESALEKYYGNHGRYPDRLTELGEAAFPTQQRGPEDVAIDYDYSVSGDSFVLVVRLPGRNEPLRVAGRQGKTIVAE